MSRLPASLLAIAILSVASNAHAFSIYFDVGGTTIQASSSDTITINVLADIDRTGLELLAVGVLFDPRVLTYNQAGSSTPTYMLYSPASGTVGSAYMVPSQNPPQLWPAPPPPVLEEVIVNWQLANLLGDPTQVTGAGLVLATLQFHVSVTGTSSIDLLLGGFGTIIRVNGDSIPIGPDTLGPPVVIGPIPEPTTALLVGAGLAALSAWGRPRRHRRGEH